MPDSTPLIRRATADDRDAVWPLARDFATSFVLEREAFASSYDALLAAADTLLLVAELEPLGIAGYLLANTHLTFLANGRVAWVEEVMVDERTRRSGIGAALMRSAEEWAVAGGAVYLALASRRAGAFYLALGYEDSAVFYKRTLSDGASGSA